LKYIGKGFRSRKSIKEDLNYKVYLDFLLEVLQATLDSNGEAQVVYSLLQANLDKLDDNLTQVLHRWTTNILPTVALDTAEDIAVALISFGSLICEFPQGIQGMNVDIGIVSFQEALQVYTQESFPGKWAKLLDLLALAYRKRIRGDRARNLEQVIICYENTLQVRSRDAFPADWAMTQMHLANTYVERLQGERALNLELAIACYEKALQVYSSETFPEDWARIKHNMAIAYCERIHGERSENIEKVIECCESALQIRTCEAFPEQWGTTQSELANAYLHRIRGERAENVEKAILYYHNALQVLTLDACPEKWATTQHNLAVAYFERTDGDWAENLEKAIICSENALQVYTRNNFPEQWARSQGELGNAYCYYPSGNRAENLAKAITCYENALQVRPRDTFPEKWAGIQSNLAMAYKQRQQIPEAIESFQSALEIFTPTAFPINCVRTGRNLGETAFVAGRWSDTIQGYAAAIDAVEQLRTWATSESRRQEILADAIDVYEKMVQACINDGQLEKAVETVERSRSKRLVDLMASNDLYQSGEMRSGVKELLQQFDDLQQQIDQERSQNNCGNHRELMGVGTNTRDRATFQAYNEAITALEAEKLEIWEQLRSQDRVLAGEIKVDAPNFIQMQKLIDQPTSAILSFYTTAQNLHIFILRQNQITLHTCPDQGIEPLQGWISQNWLQPYAASCHPNRPKSEREQLRAEWISQISPFLTELAQRLQLTDLIAKHLNGIEELLIVPHLLLHQIPFAALPIQDPEYGYLGDKFLIRYTPSCQVLEFCKQRGEVTENLSYGTVEDATNDLPFASFEGEQIAQLHQISSERRLRGSSQATRDNYRQLAEKVQVLHSCHHAESCLDAPLNSQLKLGDGNITLGQLMSPGWRLPHLSDVFLSCCETGLGLPEITDDILTLSTGFLCAGARSVVSTLWAVNDLATAIFSIFYYQHRQQGCSRPEAVRQAQIKLRELNKEELLNREDIKELSRQAEAGRKEARKQRSQYESGSANYLNWDREYRKYASVTNQIHSVKNSQHKEPFSHPRYWAAFTCSGLR
jgi:CHAT domain-containing protein/TPR repeat protein